MPCNRTLRMTREVKLLGSTATTSRNGKLCKKLLLYESYNKNCNDILIIEIGDMLL